MRRDKRSCSNNPNKTNAYVLRDTKMLICLSSICLGICLFINPQYCQVCQFSTSQTIGNVSTTTLGYMGNISALTQQCINVPISLLNCSIGCFNNTLMSCYNPTVSLTNSILGGISQLVGIFNAITQLFNVQFHCI